MTHFTRYASNKFTVLQEHAFFVSRDAIIDVVENPEETDESKAPLYSAQKTINGRHLKVVYKKEGGVAKIITFYPIRKKSHEKE